MDGFVIFGCILGAFFLLLKYLRGKETRAFLDSDVSAMESLKANREATVVDPLVAKAQAYAATITPSVTTVAAKPRYQLKDIVFTETYRNMLQVLEQELDSRYRIFVHMPLQEFIKSTNSDELGNRRISFVVCDRRYLIVVAGVEFHTQANSDHLTVLQAIFDEIKIPLIRFPIQAKYSGSVVRQKLRLISPRR